MCLMLRYTVWKWSMVNVPRQPASNTPSVFYAPFCLQLLAWCEHPQSAYIASVFGASCSLWPPAWSWHSADRLLGSVTFSLYNHLIDISGWLKKLHQHCSVFTCPLGAATSMSWEDSIHVLQLPEYMGWDSYSYILTLLQHCSNCDHCKLSSTFVVACNNKFMIQQGSLYFSHIRTYMLLEAPACVTMLPYSYVLLHSEALCITSQ